jgi:hypothetical protein
MKFLVPLTFSLLMGAAFAQDPPPPPTQQQQPSNDSLTIVGCLTKGTMEGQFTIADSKSGQKINFIAAQPMDSYLNHTVQITGTITDSGSGDKSFTPQTVKTVSDSCTGGPPDKR